MTYFISYEQFNLICVLWMVFGIITMIILLSSKIRAPYGRHSRSGWGMMIDNKLGWFLMELPALLIFPLMALLGPTEKSSLDLLLVGLWVLHYTNRTLVFPFRIKTKNKKMPISIVFSAIFFNSVNGLLNGYMIGFLQHNSSSFNSWNVITGIILFAAGFYINNKSDTFLISLRKNNEGYSVPRGWLFDKISCPNHFGEIVEWAGFALVAWNPAALSFAIWTISNLVPRAVNHHEWYQEAFDDYPKNRKAVIPYIY